MEVKAEYLEAFSEEASEMLSEWEQCLLTLENSPADRESLNDMFRAVHTLKGSAGFIQFDSLQRLAHDLESSLSVVRDGQRSYEKELSDLLFEGLDVARSLIDSFGAAQGDDSTQNRRIASVLAKLSKWNTTEAQSEASRASETAPARRKSLMSRMLELRARGLRRRTASIEEAAADGDTVTCKLLVTIDGENREAYLRSCLVKARLERLGTVTGVEPSPEALRDSRKPFVYTVTISSTRGAASISSSIALDQVSIEPFEPTPDTTPASAAEPSGMQQTAGEPPEAKPAGPESTREAPTEDPEQKKIAKATRNEEVVRVSVQKLDTLLNLVGELVVQNSGFIATTQQLKHRFGKTPDIFDLEEKTEALSIVTRDLQEGIMKARMLAIGNIFERFRRVVRDLSRSSGKSVALEVYGEETEIDKKVIDRIGEPLLHLVRNAVDHGLETVEERRLAGKPDAGMVRLGAYQDGDHICVEVSDDGKGLDREAILAKAIERGLVGRDEAESRSAEEIFGLIFVPGFSTARTVTDISGRGVGMDAVKRAVEAMNGNVRVTSERNAGTTVTITFPLTMAIIGAVLVEAAGSIYAIPVSTVREIVKSTKAIARTVGNRRAILLRNEVLSLVRLAEALECRTVSDCAKGDPPAPSGEGNPIVVVDFEGSKVGIEVDGIIGSREVVIKSLSRHYREVGGLIGASILGNGKIALIVDVEALINQFRLSGTGRATAVAPKNVTATHVPSGPPEVPAAVVTAEEANGPTSPELDRVEKLASALEGEGGHLIGEVNNQGALQASMALTELTGGSVSVSFPQSRLVALRDVDALFGGDEHPVAGVYVGVQGNLSGGMLLVIPEGNLLVLNDLLHRRAEGSSRGLDDVDLSGIAEMGNVLASCFINAMADASHLSASPEVPEVTVDMCTSVVDSVLARFNQPGERLLLTDAVIYAGGKNDVVCHQILVLEPDSLRRLMDALAAPLEAAGA